MKLQRKEETKERKGSRELELDKQHHKSHTDQVTLAIGQRSCAILHGQLNESDLQPLRLNGMDMPAYSLDLLNHAVLPRLIPDS
jgi:hypothetical protein